PQGVAPPGTMTKGRPPAGSRPARSRYIANGRADQCQSERVSAERLTVTRRLSRAVRETGCGKRTAPGFKPTLGACSTVAAAWFEPKAPVEYTWVAPPRRASPK